MKDNEIIKALECFSDKCEDDCMNCPIEGVRGEIDVFKGSLDLINRQKAEIERLQEHIKHTNNVVKQVVEDTKSEAIKEFAERLTALFEQFDTYDTLHIYEITDRIDNLLEEMESERE